MLEEAPLQYLPTGVTVLGEQFRAIGQLVQDCIGFAEESLVFDLQHRDAAVRVDLLELFGVGSTGKNIHCNPFMFDAQQGHEQFDLVAIAGIDIAVDFYHAHFT